MHWIVQENIRDEASYDAFIQALEDNGIDYTIVKVIPFAHLTIPDVNPTADIVLAWGSVCMDEVAQNKGWKPGTFLNDLHNQITWTAMYGRENVLNGDVEFYEFCKIPKYEGTRFIRPVDDKKRFDGSVVHTEEIENWKEAVLCIAGDGYSRIRPDTLVGVASVKEIAREWRFFVVNGKVVTGSRYRQWGLSDQRRAEPDSEEWIFCQRMVDKWQPAKAFVLDIALTAADEYKVIEVNCINSAGLYQADMNVIVKAVKELYEPS